MTKQSLRNLIIAGLVSLIFIACPVGAMADSTTEFSDAEPDLFIGIALSGGGFRSAAFSHGALAELNRLKLCVYKEKDSRREDSVKVLIHESNKDCENPDKASYLEIANGTILESAHAISAVSGGAIAGAYYALNNDRKISDLGDNFRLKVLHETDKFKDSIVPGSLDALWFMLSASSKEGVIDNSKTIKYYDGLYEGKTLGDLEKAGKGKRKATENHRDKGDIPLLIHATDLTTESIFTFAENDMKCLTRVGENWGKIPVSVAIGASSALPGLITPVKLPNNGDPNKVGEECNRFFGNKIIRRDVVLVDGGIYDNLALDGLLRYFVNQKRIRKLAAKAKALILVFNAETTSRFTNAGADTDKFPVAQVLNQSMGLLMNNRIGVSKSLFGMLEPIGIKVIDISFQDLINDTSLRHLWEKRAADLLEGGNTFDVKSAFEIARMQIRDIEDLNAIRTMFPDTAQIDAVIAAGSLATRYSLHRELPGAIMHLLSRDFAAKCSSILDVSKDYCWPSGWLLKNPFEATMKERISEVQAANEDHLQHHLEVAQEQLERFINTLKARLNKMDDPEQEKEFYSPEYNVQKVIERINRQVLPFEDETLVKSFLTPAGELLKSIKEAKMAGDLESPLKLAQKPGLIDGELLKTPSTLHKEVCAKYSSVPHCYSLVGILYLDAALKASDSLRREPLCDVNRDKDCKRSLLLLKQALSFKVIGNELLKHAASDPFQDSQAAYMYSIVKWLAGKAELTFMKKAYDLLGKDLIKLEEKAPSNTDQKELVTQHSKLRDYLDYATNQYIYYAAIAVRTGTDDVHEDMMARFKNILDVSTKALATKQIEEMEVKLTLKKCLANARTIDEETSCDEKNVAELHQRVNTCVLSRKTPEDLDKCVQSRKMLEEIVNTFTATKLLNDYVDTIRDLERVVKEHNVDEIYKKIGESFRILGALRANNRANNLGETPNGVLTGLNFSQTAIRWLGEEETFLRKLPSHFHTQAK